MRRPMKTAAPPLVAAMLFALTSCPNPMDTTMVSRQKDLVAPVITITSPADNSAFARTIVITGTVRDTSDATGDPGGVQSLTWEILAHQAAQPATVDSTGAFTITTETTLAENIVIQLKAVDWNGNSSSVRLPLTWKGNDIPTFAATPGNRQVTLSWTAVPGVSSYTVYFEPSPLAPTIATSAKIENATSPYVFGNLKNGNVYSFLLRGASVSGSDNYSQIERAVPLSTYDLFPSVKPFYNQIQISWRAIPGISQYEVMRSSSPGGPFESVSGPVTGSLYTDRGVRQGEAYYYAVKPAQYCDIVSEVAEGILDPFATPQNSEMATYTSVDTPQATALKGNYLLIADYYAGLKVANVAEPSTPMPVTTVNTITSLNDIVIDGNYAYVSHGQSLSVFDVTNPASPMLLDTLALTTFGAGGQAEGVSVLGNWAFVALFNDGFAIVNTTDKRNLTLAYKYDMGTNPEGFLQTYNTAAVDRGGGIAALFVASLTKTAIYEVTGAASSPTVTVKSTAMDAGDDIKVIGTKAYMTSGWKLEVWDVTTLALPTQYGTGLMLGPPEPPEALDVVGGRAYVTIRDTGFCVVDVSNPSSLALLRSYGTPGQAKGITVSGSYAYVADGTGKSVGIFGIASPQSPTLVGSFTTLVGPTNLVAFRDRILVTETRNDWALSVVNAADPASLTLEGSTDSYSPLNLKIVGQRAYFAAERMGIMMYDISNLATPSVLPPWYVDLPGGNALGIDVLGSYAYVSTAGSQLVVADLSWTGDINRVGSVVTQTVNPSYSALDVEVTNDYAFVANAEAGLRVVDIRDPHWPAALANAGATAGRAVAVALSGTYAFVADETNGLYVFDVSNPKSPQQVRAPGSEGGTKDVVVRGGYAYLALGASGIQVWDISNPAAASPPVVATFATATPVVKLAVNRQYVYAIDSTSTMYAINLLP